MFRIEVLPAAHGDALWVEYGDTEAPVRVVIDGGPAPTYAGGLLARVDILRRAPRRQPGPLVIDLLVVTHIDCDHIDGTVIFLQQCRDLNIRINEIWFNGWKQLAPPSVDSLQPLQGEFLGALVSVDSELRGAWNKSFRGSAHGLAAARTTLGPDAVFVPEEGPLPQINLPQNAKLTLLSPYSKQLERLRKQWSAAIRGFSPGDESAALERLAQRREYRPPPAMDMFSAGTVGADRSAPNGSSIAFVLEHEAHSCLFGADAHARVLTTSLARFAKERGLDRVHFDAVKLPHHGSIGNISDDLLALINCDNWLISTNGAIFDHPDRETVERICHSRKSPARIFCNYRAESTLRLQPVAARNEMWTLEFPVRGVDQTHHPFRAPTGGLRIDIPITEPPPAAAAVPAAAAGPAPQQHNPAPGLVPAPRTNVSRRPTMKRLRAIVKKTRRKSPTRQSRSRKGK